MLFKKILINFRSSCCVISKRFMSKQKLPDGWQMEVSKAGSDLDETIEFLSWTFVRDEPIVAAMGIEDTCDLQRYLKRQAAHGTAIRVMDEACQTLALALCSVNKPKSSQDVRTFAECSICDQRTRRLLNLWADISESHNLFKCFKVDEIWDISILSTAPAARGKGLAKLLTNEARKLGKKEGFSITRMDCTSFFSAKLAQSLKFVTLPPRHVTTYRDKKGCPWICCEPPHPHGHIVVAYDFLV